MALKTMIENLNKAREAYEAQLKGLGKQAKNAVVEFLAPHIPAGCELYWTQYTPYFNDGEACTFSVNEPKLRKIEENNDDSDRGVDVSKWGIESYGKQLWAPLIEGVTKKALNDLRKAWEELPEDLLLKAFGDHTEVTINADCEYTDNEYNHG
jgi:hypothetical protein